MKKRLTVLSILVLMTMTIAPQIFGQDSPRHYRDDSDYSERDEINQTYQLSAGARVEVRGINGAVDIETASGSTAEVHIVRTARSREDLNYHKIIIEPTANSLVVRGEKEKDHESGEHSVRQRVTLRLPRQ